MDDDVAALVETALPQQTVLDIGGTGPSWNHLNETYRVDCETNTFYLKHATDGDATRITREVAVLNYLSQNSQQHVPTVHRVDTDHDPPYLVTTQLRGRPVIEADSNTDAAGRRDHLRVIVRTLARVHEHKYDAHGHIVGGDADGLEIDHAPWSTVLADRVEFMRALGPSTRFDHYFDAVQDRITTHNTLLDDAPATLLHGDPAKPNCVLHEGTAGLLDWEIAYIGDPARDLRRSHRQLAGGFKRSPPPNLVDAVNDGYRAVAGSLPRGFNQREPIYAAVTFLGVCGFFEKYVQFRDESEAELEEWVTGQMDRRLSRIDERL